MTLQRTTGRIAPAVREFLASRITDDMLAEWDVSLVANREALLLGLDQFEATVLIYLAVDCPENGTWISVTVGVPVSKATNEEVIERVRVAWDEIVLERLNASIAEGGLTST